MGRFVRAVAGFWVGCVVFGAGLAAAAKPASADFNGETASAEARTVARWAVGQRDARGRPFAIVDKRQARLYVFGVDGRLLGATSVLLGAAVGDDSVPGIGARPTDAIEPHERTTPAGRFDSEPGRNLTGEAIVWFDYHAALAIHRLRPAPLAQRREQRLASRVPADKRISLGCIVVGEAFYDAVVAPSLGSQRGVVYVLPETRGLADVFGQPTINARL